MQLHLGWDGYNPVHSVGLITTGLPNSKPNLWVGLRWSTEFFLGCSSAHKDSPSGSVEKVGGGGAAFRGRWRLGSQQAGLASGSRWPGRQGGMLVLVWHDFVKEWKVLWSGSCTLEYCSTPAVEPSLAHSVNPSVTGCHTILGILTVINMGATTVPCQMRDHTLC